MAYKAPYEKLLLPKHSCISRSLNGARELGARERDSSLSDLHTFIH